MIETLIYTPRENEEEDRRVLRERGYLIACLVLLLGILFLVLEMKIGFLFFFSGFILLILSKFSLLAGKPKKLGHFSEKFVINTEGIKIGSKSIAFVDVDNIEIILRSTKGELKGDFNQLWKADGTNNSVKLQMDNRITEFNFLIDNDYQYVTLSRLKFPENIKVTDLTSRTDS